MNKTNIGLKENYAIALCYLFGWISGIIMFFLEKENKKVRYHAVQSILVTVAIIILPILLGITIIGIVLIPAVPVAAFVMYVVFIYNALKGNDYRISIFEKVANTLFEKDFFNNDN